MITVKVDYHLKDYFKKIFVNVKWEPETKTWLIEDNDLNNRLLALWRLVTEQAKMKTSPSDQKYEVWADNYFSSEQWEHTN